MSAPIGEMDQEIVTDQLTDKPTEMEVHRDVTLKL